jgi:hypothetical protein
LRLNALHTAAARVDVAGFETVPLVVDC